MKCPKCAAALRRVTRGTVVIDACDLCYGIWLDKHELEHIVTQEHDNAAALDTLKTVVTAPRLTTNEKGRPCPVCAVLMEKMNYQAPEPVLVDVCAQCGGSWFDSGELVSVTDALKNVLPAGKKEAPAVKKNTIVGELLLLSVIVALFVAAALLLVSLIRR